MQYKNDQILELLSTHYQLSGSLKSLMGETDDNYLLNAADGTKYTVKISAENSEQDSIEFEAAMMNHLAAKDFPLDIPKVTNTLKGHAYVSLEQGQYLRVQKWVAGEMLDKVNPRSEAVLKNWGETAGYLSKYLQDFDHPTAHRSYKWNPSETLTSKQYLPFFNEEEKTGASYFWDLFERIALPKLNGLRHSVNYNDAHEHNLIVDHLGRSDDKNKNDFISPKISGVIDFGDGLYTATICELAIACAYAGMHAPDPITAMKSVVQGYHEIFSIEEKELEILFPLITARLMITVASAAWNKHNEPDNEYLLISERPAWDLLNKLKTIAPAFAHYSFRDACGLEPCPQRIIFDEWFKNGKHNFSEIVKFGNEKVIPMDLSVGSLDLGAQENFMDIDKFHQRIDKILDDGNAKFGIGGYAEPRAFYSTDAYQVEGNQGAQWRTVHLGVDVWGAVGTKIFAPLDGEVISIKNNDAERDYGPTLILKHTIHDDLIFYTLYGHLELDVFDLVKKGDVVFAGQLIASFGAAPINGNWPPHLHFQILLDQLGIEGDFPGASFPNEQAVYCSICPDPISEDGSYQGTRQATLFPNIKKEKRNISAEEIVNIRKEHLGKSLSLSYNDPLHMVRGHMQWLYDAQARRYLDTVNNVPHVGHQHPKVVAAGKAQMDLLNTNTRYLHANIVEFAEALVETFPEKLSVVHFVNSGSEANELAMRMVEAYTGSKEMIAVEVGYHGNTSRSIDVSSYKFDGKGGKGKPEGTQIIPMPDTYRGPYREETTVGALYANHVDDAIEAIVDEGKKVGGFIAESILSCGGQIVLPPEYLKNVYRKVRTAGGLCIADEVQVGFGRVGEKFWGFELQEVTPDIVTLGKPIGNGHPLAAVVCTQEVAEAFANGMEFFNTFGGNPVSCAIGSAVLQVVQEDNLQSHAQEIGEYLLNGLNVLKDKYSIIGDVRGHGLFLGIELVRDRVTIEPAAEECTYLVNRMRERGILMSTDGPLHNVIKIKPPMCFDQSNAEYLLRNLDEVLQENFMNL